MRNTGEQLLTIDRQMDETGKLDGVIRENLVGLGYGR